MIVAVSLHKTHIIVMYTFSKKYFYFNEVHLSCNFENATEYQYFEMYYFFALLFPAIVNLLLICSTLTSRNTRGPCY